MAGQCRIRNLRVLIQDQGVVLQGQSDTYYAKQLAQHAVLDLTDPPILANEIEVRSSAAAQSQCRSLMRRNDRPSSGLNVHRRKRLNIKSKPRCSKALGGVVTGWRVPAMTIPVMTIPVIMFPAKIKSGPGKMRRRYLRRWRPPERVTSMSPSAMCFVVFLCRPNSN